jgi:hypothetical protein
MAAYNKFLDFSEQLAKGVQNFGTDTYKVALSNTLPLNTYTSLSEITQISAGNGYTTGGSTTTTSVGETSGTSTVSGTEVIFEASGGTIGPFQYAVLYNDSATSPADALVAWWDYGSSVTLADGETFRIQFNNASPGAIFTLA